MQQLILGKKLISDTEIIWYCRGPDNSRHLPLTDLHRIAAEAAAVTSAFLIRMCQSAGTEER